MREEVSKIVVEYHLELVSVVQEKQVCDDIIEVSISNLLSKLLG